MNPPRSILLIMTRRIGDVLLSTPVIHSLKRAWPDVHIDVLVFRGTQGVLEANPDIREVITIPERPSARAHWQLLKRLWRRYDWALSLLTGDRPTLYAWWAGRWRAGFIGDVHKDRWKTWLLNSHLLFDNLDTHTVRMNLAILSLVGVKPYAEVASTWHVSDAEQVRALLNKDQSQLHTQSQPRPQSQPQSQLYAVLHAYPKFNYKMWHQAGWLAVAQHWQAQGWRVVLTGSNDPAEQHYVAELAAQLPEALNLCGQLSLAQTACLLSQSQAYVGPDTAVTHMAAAAGIPTVALFGPSNPVKWGPWPKGWPHDQNPWQKNGTQQAGNVTLVQGSGDCVPCLLEGCERHEASFSQCLQQLPTQQVLHWLKSQS